MKRSLLIATVMMFAAGAMAEEAKTAAAPAPAKKMEAKAETHAATTTTTTTTTATETAKPAEKAAAKMNKKAARVACIKENKDLKKKENKKMLEESITTKMTM